MEWVYLPRSATIIKILRTRLWVSAVLICCVCFVAWIGYSQNDFGRPQEWVRIVAVTGGMLVAIATFRNTSDYLRGRSLTPLLASRQSPYGIASPLSATLHLGRWFSPSATATLRIDRRLIRTGGTHTEKMVFLSFSAPDCQTLRVAISGANPDFDWYRWGQETFAAFANLSIEDGESAF